MCGIEERQREATPTQTINWQHPVWLYISIGENCLSIPTCVICGEMIHAGREEAVDIYYILIKKIWTTEKWPLDWKNSIYVPLPKKKRSADVL